jgi:hypothetical protein
MLWIKSDSDERKILNSQGKTVSLVADSAEGIRVPADPAEAVKRADEALERLADRS